MLHQIKGDMEVFGVNLRGVCDLEDTLEANALLANVANCVLLGSAAHITKGSDVALCESHLAQRRTIAAPRRDSQAGHNNCLTLTRGRCYKV